MSKKKDVLFLCQYFYPEFISSATLPFDTALSLSKEGLDVEALCGYPKEYNLENNVPLIETYKGIKITRLKYLQLKRSNFVGRLINYFSFTIAVILRFLKLKDYKVIIVYSNPPILPLIASLAKKFFNTKVVFVSYDIYPEIAYVTNTINKNGVLGKLMEYINGFVTKHITKVIALSNEMKDYLLEHRIWLKDSQVEVIPNWFENKKMPDSVDSKNIFSKLKNGNNLVVSYFGNMGTCQDLDTLIKACRELKKNNRVKFLFAGHGNKLEYLKAVVKNERLSNVYVYDFLHGKDFEDALNISDTFIVSLAEGLSGLAVPSKTYSYMMTGKPVIAVIDKNSDIANDLIDNHAGYAMEVGESSKLVSAILELLNDLNKRSSMGDNCRKIFLEKYTTEICTQKYVKMIKRVLED
ncbi:glycosyltransferase family 4 protein [Pseudalkalibacillus sp. SCS-8]|uniref:glycosyltransferase family 4 protein n=1 Tax=Pseudalkalibacillus nanhaiensis TaxID=3115291 RepID=UPI0032DBB594